MPDPQIDILLLQCFAEGEVRVEEVPSTRDNSRDAMLTESWTREKSRLGQRLFDGVMTRFESFDVTDNLLVLRVSRTSYRTFVNTNLHGPLELADACCANPIGVSAAVQTSDQLLLLGLRGDGVAYYPNRLHPFAGSLEWPASGEKINVFDECRRELLEELGLQANEINHLELLGIARDRRLRHPELILHAICDVTSDTLRKRLRTDEHDALHAFPTTVAALEEIAQNPALTPVAGATLRFVIPRVGHGGGCGV